MVDGLMVWPSSTARERFCLAAFGDFRRIQHGRHCYGLADATFSATEARFSLAARHGGCTFPYPDCHLPLVHYYDVGSLGHAII